MRRIGFVSLVGAGPGAADLLTLRAAERIKAADALVVDRLVHPDVLKLAKPRARILFVGKEGGGEQTPQDEIHRLLIDQAGLGRTVVRLKGGDPFVFGRGGEEALALHAAGVPFEVVPGLSSGTAVPALAGIPVTHRGVAASVTFATAHRAAEEPNWAALAHSETLVLFMAGRKLNAVCESLIAAGRSPQTPAAILEAGSWEHGRVFTGTLRDIAATASDAEVGSPALFVVGEVVALRHALAAAEPVLTRAEARQ